MPFATGLRRIIRCATQRAPDTAERHGPARPPGRCSAGAAGRPACRSVRSHPTLISSCETAETVRVLIVEDEVKMASLIRRGLREEGLSADVAIKGEDALWMAGSTEYSAIILDVMLPGIDGYETCKRLRADG